MANNFADLDALFECPPWVTEPGDRALHAVMLIRWQQEAAALPLSMAQMCRISMAIKGMMRVQLADAHSYGPDGFVNAGAELDYKKAVQGLLRDIDDVLHKNRTGDDLVPKARVKQAVLAALSTIPDEEIAERRRMAVVMANELDGIGVH